MRGMVADREKLDRSDLEQVLQELATSADEIEVPATNHVVKLTHLSKVMLTMEQGSQTQVVTKRQLLQYYCLAAQLLLPHLLDRPLTLKRYPQGLMEPGFAQRHIEDLPPFVATVEMYSD